VTDQHTPEADAEQVEACCEKLTDVICDFRPVDALCAMNHVLGRMCVVTGMTKEEALFLLAMAYQCEKARPMEKRGDC
jgi:hypothetical protein